MEWPRLVFGPVNLWSVWTLWPRCVGKCRNVSGVCSGCGRTFEEFTEEQGEEDGLSD